MSSCTIMICFLLGLIGGSKVILAEPLAALEDFDSLEELQDAGYDVQAEAVQDSGNVCMLEPSFSLECEKPRELFYYDQRAKACKSRMMCSPKDFGNAFATEESCENICVDDVDAENVQEESEQVVEDAGDVRESEEEDYDESLFNPEASRVVWYPDPGYHRYHRNVKLNLYMTATSSSQWNSEHSPSKAVDGNIKTLFHSNLGDSYPWLVVDMGRPVIVHKILAHLREGQAGRFNNVEARVGDYQWTFKRTRITVNTFCSCPKDIIVWTPTRWLVCDKPIRGRFLSLQILSPAKNNLFLEVREIEIYGVAIVRW